MGIDKPSPIAHEGAILIGESCSPGAPPSLGSLTARFVRYPSCQQLTLWLPQPAHLGYGELRLFDAAGRILERGPVLDWLSGSVQVLWDTLPWPAGAYRIEIDHIEGWRHELALQKLPAHEELPPHVTQDPAPGRSLPYCDGHGRPLPDADLLLRREAFLALQRRFSRRMEYDCNHRAGTMTYVDGERRIVFAYELSAAGLAFWIELPTEAQWLLHTGTPVAERTEIVQFVAERVQRDQGAGRFEIRANAIHFY